jgi:hypothetical protein
LIEEAQVGTHYADFDRAADPNDVGGPGDTLSPIEALDPDDVRNTDGDEVVDPPDGWSEADKYGMTEREEREGEPLDYKLAAEEPDPSPDGPDDADESDPTDDVAAESEDAELRSDYEIDHLVRGLHGISRGQVDGAPEDGDPLFPVIQ